MDANRRELIARAAGRMRAKRSRRAREVRRARLQLAQEAVSDAGQAGFSAGWIEQRSRRGDLARIGKSANARQIYHDPAVTIAWKIRRALTAPARGSMVAIRDAAGRLIAWQDPITRERWAVRDDGSVTE